MILQLFVAIFVSWGLTSSCSFWCCWCCNRKLIDERKLFVTPRLNCNSNSTFGDFLGFILFYLGRCTSKSFWVSTVWLYRFVLCIDPRLLTYLITSWTGLIWSGTTALVLLADKNEKSIQLVLNSRWSVFNIVATDHSRYFQSDDKNLSKYKWFYNFNSGQRHRILWFFEKLHHDLACNMQSIVINGRYC